MIIALLGLVVASVVFCYLCHYGIEEQVFILFFLGALGALISASAMVFYACVAFDWVAAEYKASIINREYGTNYTQEEIFYGSKVIETIRELDRKRIELNGNLINGDNK